MIPLSGGRELLEAAVSYALAGAAMATPPLLSRPTPCPGWYLGTLLDHLEDLAGVLGEGDQHRLRGAASPGAGR